MPPILIDSTTDIAVKSDDIAAMVSGKAQVKPPKFYGQFMRYHSQMAQKDVPAIAEKLPAWLILLGAADIFSVDIWAATFIEFFGMLFLFPIHCNAIVHAVKTYGPSGDIIGTCVFECSL